MIRPLYLDPGSASILLQMITGGVVAAAVALKLFWRRILVALHLKSRDEDSDSSVGPGPR